MCIRRVDQDASSPMHRRGDQYNRSTAGHQRQQLLHQEDGGAGVEIECLFEMFTRQGIDQSLLRQTGIRNSDVDNALFGPHRCSDTVEVIEICDISLDCRHIFPISETALSNSTKPELKRTAQMALQHLGY